MRVASQCSRICSLFLIVALSVGGVLPLPIVAIAAGSHAVTTSQPGRARYVPDRILVELKVAPAGDTGLATMGILRDAGVEIDRRTGIAVDGDIHRVVEMRTSADSAGRVMEVVRPGYALHGRMVREADVVATQ